MEETISVRIPKEELREIEFILEYENTTKSAILREVIEKGVKEKRLEVALEQFRREEATAWKAAKIAGMPLTKFLDVLVERNIDFHYTKEDLLEDTKDLLE